MPKRMNKRVKELWVKALRSGEYKQGTGHLRDKNNNFCCLGVLCNIHAQENPNSSMIKDSVKGEDFYTYGGSSVLPPVAVQKWAGIYNKDIYVNRLDNMAAHLWRRNDGVGQFIPHTFEQMADFIEQNL
jgi:hypothetical protein